MLVNRKFILAALFVLMVASVGAQNTTSPYSMYGYGVLKDKAVGASKGMGGISYGVRGQFSNPGNPASYSAVDSLTFIFDMGVSYSNAKLSDSSGSQNDDNGGLDYITMLFPVTKKFGISFGILPYSSIGYSFGRENTEGGSTYQEYFSGSGNLSQVYGGLAYDTPIKGLSVGANVSYLFGTLRHNMTVPFTSSSIYSRGRYDRLKINAVKFDLGAQYQMDLGDRKALTLGVVYTPQIKPSARYSFEDILSSGVTIDSLLSTGVDTQLPATYGVGFTYTDGRNLLFGADFTYQKWSDLDYPSEFKDSLSRSERFNNRIRVNAGIEYVIDPFDRNFFKKVKFRAGGNYSNSYLNVKNKQGQVGGYKEYGATIGLGLPLSRDVYTQRISYVNISFEYTKLKPEVSSMVQEEYFGVSLNMNINDLWFMKNKFK